jgi:hypothetical protein
MYPSNEILFTADWRFALDSASTSVQRARAIPACFSEANGEKRPAESGNVQQVEADEREDQESQSSEEYFSVADDSEEEDDKEEDTDADWEAREKERQRVLEAAGLIVNQDVKPPPRLARARSTRPRRPAPAAPQRSSIISNLSAKDLPPVPDSPAGNSPRLDDAFDRYETFKHTQGSLNRLSFASSSFEAAPSSPAVSLTPSTSKESDNRPKSYLLNFLGRRTPANDGSERRTLTISGPIMSTSEGPSRENSPAFGSVTLCTLPL